MVAVGTGDAWELWEANVGIHLHISDVSLGIAMGSCEWSSLSCPGVNGFWCEKSSCFHMLGSIGACSAAWSLLPSEQHSLGLLESRQRSTEARGCQGPSASALQ